MTDRELMQQALDAMLNFPNDISDEMFESIKALRAALAKEQENSRSQKMIDAGFTKRDTLLECDGCGKKFSRLMLPIHVCENAQPEPVLVSPKEFISAVTGKWDIQGIPMLMSVWPVPEKAQPEQEPVAWLYKKKDGMQVITDDPDYADGTWTPLYTAPPQREWQGLTDEEIEKLVYDIRSQTTGVVATAYVARAIEAKLKEKNT